MTAKSQSTESTGYLHINMHKKPVKISVSVKRLDRRLQDDQPAYKAGMRVAKRETATGDALTDQERGAISEAIKVNGESRVCVLLSLRSHTLARVVSGLRIQRGTVALVRQGLAANPESFTGGPVDGAPAAQVAGVADGKSGRAGKGGTK